MNNVHEESETRVVPDDALTSIVADPRVRVRNGASLRVDGKCVVLWMQRAMRIDENPALDAAIASANVLRLPVVVYVQLIANYANANLRAYHFLEQGLLEAAQDAARRGVGFVVRRSPAKLEAFLEEVRAALLVGDENPCREPERWRAVLARRLRIPFWTVDADVVVPSQIFGKSFFLLHHFRPHLQRELPRFLVRGESLQSLVLWKPETTIDQLECKPGFVTNWKSLDRSVAPVENFQGGPSAARQRLRAFVRYELKDYDERRNHPEKRGTSRLSPWLHFGHIGPLTAALAAQDAVAEGLATQAALDRFLEELIGWRELAVLYVRHEPNYDNWLAAAPWAQKTLLEHASDARPALYSLEQLERAETHDDLWNAAQREMVNTGWMHGYMRMYWAKKILEWSPDPSTAFDRAVILNDRYELDGRDPNGYAGIAWAIVGRHDRPWYNRPVFGLIRTMTSSGVRKKFDADAYVRQQG